MPRRRDGIYHRKDGLWEARYVKEVDLTGKKKYGSVYGHSYKEAREKRQDALAHIVLYQKPPSARRITVKELAAEWLLVNQSRLKPSTCQRYQGFLKNHLEGSLGAMEVLYVTTVTIHQFAVERLASGLAPQTVNAILTLLHSILKYGHRQYQLPIPEIIYLSVEKKEMRVLAQEEQKKLVAYLMHDLDVCKLGILVALYTGLRVGELCALKWEDIDKDSITVRRTMLGCLNLISSDIAGSKPILHLTVYFKSSTNLRIESTSKKIDLTAKILTRSSTSSHLMMSDSKRPLSISMIISPA